MSSNDTTLQQEKSLTILLPAGRLPLPVTAKVHELATRYGLRLYLSALQNLRLLGVKEDDMEAIKAELAPLGVSFKGPGKFPLPKVCIGKPSCNMGIVDPADLSARILERFGSRTNVKPKFKIAISGCILSCGGALLADIGVVATRNGYDLYFGGKGGPYPKVGRRILRDGSEEEVLAAIGKLVDFHDAKTAKKQRMVKLLEDPEFPFVVEV
ncbi:MAG: nitrite reductase [Desulfobulbaceae bacterium]|nr:nitrite reductase [Desulfobulbaceae bacterium]